MGGGMPAEGGGSAKGGLAESWEVGVEAWMTCCCLAVGVSIEEAWVGRSLDEFLRPLRKVRTAALPILRLGPGWCSRPVSLSHCLMENVSLRDATPLVSRPWWLLLQETSSAASASV